MARWPHDDPASLAAFYGDPNTGEPGRQLVPVTPPFQMYYDGKPIAHIMFHKKAAGALLAALQEVWEQYGKSQSKIDLVGVSKFSGSYNPRKIRGSATRWSNHAYGAAIDLNAEHNGFNTGHGDMPQPVIDAFKRQGALWGGDYHGRTDPMHFEFCSRGETAPPPPVHKPPPAPIEPPQTDGDTTAPQPEPTPQPTPVPLPTPSPVPTPTEPSQPWYKKVWTWVSGGGIGALGIGGYTFSGLDPITVAIIVGAIVLVFLVVWFTKKGRG